MVAAPHPDAACAGIEALRQGGNAFDAIVAAAFTEAVVEPAHNGVAGYGGAMVGWHAGVRRVVCVDFNAEAPAAAHPQLYRILPGEGALYTVEGAAHREGAASIAVPGVVAGLEEIHRSWGHLPLAALLEPAIRAAAEGWTVNLMTASNLAEHAAPLRERHPETAALLLPGGRVPARGERLANPALADTLRHLAGSGLRTFYEGEIAERIVTGLAARGGLLSREDLRRYRARHVQALSVGYRGRELCTPPVGCGGVTSLQMLMVLEGFDLAQWPLPGAELFHLLIEVMKPCWRMRLTELGDPAFTHVAESTHLQPAVIQELRERVRRGLAHPEPGTIVGPEPFNCTSHLCAADATGNVASLTQTHGGAFGSYVTLPELGLTFGHGMARFDPRPGLPNSIAPGKRPLHNMAPFVVLRDGWPEALYGTPGGRTIVNNQAYFSLALLAYGLDAHTALAVPRLHCEEAEPAKLEEAAGPEALAALRALGHLVEPVERNGGCAQAITVGADPGQLAGATDPRGDGLVTYA
jgi:gamma-glutamyltranspeptidase/glutathione hydrolase